MKNSSLFRIIIFYLIAVSLSNLVRFNVFNTEELFHSFPVWTKALTTPLQSFGVFLGAMLSIYFLRKQKGVSNSLMGTSAKYSFLMALVPLLVFSIFGIENSLGIHPNLLGLIMGIALLIYCIFEEYGWRGYLEDELKDSKEWKRVLIISTLWYAWHLSFLNNTDVLQNLKFFAIILVGTWGIGKVIQSTKSVVSVACFHMIYNILILNVENSFQISGDKKLIIIGICSVVWIVLVKLWERDNLKALNESIETT